MPVRKLIPKLQIKTYDEGINTCCPAVTYVSKPKGPWGGRGGAKFLMILNTHYQTFTKKINGALLKKAPPKHHQSTTKAPIQHLKRYYCSTRKAP
jgi:hypothetical protein